MGLELHAMLPMGKTLHQNEDGAFIFTFKTRKSNWLILWSREGYTMPVIPKCKFHIFENSLHYKHLLMVLFQTYSACVAVQITCVHLKRLFCLLQAVYYRTSESFFLPADGGLDSHHRPSLYSQTSASGSADLCPRLPAHFLLCHEHSGGEHLSEWCVTNVSICKCE